MPELRGPRRSHGGQRSEPGARVKAEAAEGGGASAPALRRATGSDIIKASKSTLTSKTVAHPSKIATALVQPAEARAILTGKQAIMKPCAGRLSRLCSFSMWQ